MSKNIHIYDVKYLNIFQSGKTRGPVIMRMEDSVIRRLLNQVDGPRDMYAIDPKNPKREIKITINNYNKTEEELFGSEPKVSKTVAPQPKEEDQTMKQALESLKRAKEQEMETKTDTKSEEVKDEVSNVSKVDEAIDVTVNSVEEPVEENITEETQEQENANSYPKNDEFANESAKEESDTVQETVSEKRPSNNYKNYNKYNKKKNNQ